MIFQKIYKLLVVSMLSLFFSWHKSTVIYVKAEEILVVVVVVVVIVEFPYV